MCYINYKRPGIIWAFVLLVPFALQAQTTTLPLDPAVRTGKLANGFTYYIRHNESPKNRVSMYLVNKVGSVLEDNEQQGLAHFIEHMSFNGTKHFPKSELVNYLQKSGVRFGADLNAYTSFDETVYQLPLPSDQPEILKNGIQIIRDWAQEATLDAVEINKERGVVLEEKRNGKGAAERMQRQYWPSLLNNSRYAVRIPIGIDEVLNNFKPETIRRFYHDWYRPDLQALIVVGDIDVNQIVKTIKAKFGDLKNPVKEKNRTKYTVPLTGKNQFLTVTDKEMTSTTAQLYIKHPGLSVRSSVDFRKMFVRTLFNRMLAARYAEVIQQRKPPYIQGSAGVQPLIGGLDVFAASVTAKPGELETGFKALWREIERLKQFGFTLSELERAKQAYMGQLEMLIKEKDKTSSDAYIKEYLQYFLKGTAAPGIEKEYELVKSTLPGIRLDDVDHESFEYITDSNRDILIMAPDKDKASLPDDVTVNGWMKEVAQEKLAQYKDDISKQALLTSEPIAGKIIKEEKDEALNITTLLLSNGAKVILKPTDFKNDEILVGAFGAGGTSLYNDADYQSAANAATIIPAGGVGNLSMMQLGKFLSGKKAGVKPFITERNQGLVGTAAPKDIETALQLLYGNFTQPRKDPDVFGSIVERSVAGLANRSVNPVTAFQDSAIAFLYHNNFRKTGPMVEKVKQISLDRSYEIYKERFSDASNFTFMFVGSFRVEEIKPLIEKYIASLPATDKHEQARDLHLHLPEGKLEKTIYKGKEPKASVVLVFNGLYEYSTENNLQMQALKEVLNIRLLQRLREDESGVYTPNIALQVSKYPEQRYTFQVAFGCAPENVEKLIASTLNEINKLKTAGPLQVNIDKFKAEEQRSFDPKLKTNVFWFSWIEAQTENHESLSQFKDYPVNLQKITPESLKKLAQKYLGGENYIRIELLPETTK